METITLQDEGELTLFAKKVIADFSETKIGATVMLLSGDLGVGKTTFVKKIGEALGVMEHITSPTFILMKHYEIREHTQYRTLTHIDGYRFEEVREADVLNLPELLKDPKRIVAIEWPERFDATIFSDPAYISFEIGENGTRLVSYEKNHVS